jgi:hypothetical protein
MAKAKTDWGFLRGALGVFAICVLISAGLIAGSLYFRASMESDFKRHQAAFQTASRRYLSVDEEERMIREHYPQFVEWYNRGVLGRENRLNWLEVIRYAGQHIRMPELRYQIESQAPYSPPFPVQAAGYNIHASIMKLEMGLLHEYDLASMLDELNRRAAGLYSVDRCLLTRTQKQIGSDASQKNINAACELRWLTINTPGEGIVLK